VGSLAVLGERSQLGESAVVENAIVGARAVVGEGCVVAGSIVGDDAAIGAGSEVRSLSVVGPGASLGTSNELDHGLRIAADQRIPAKALRFS
jgi:NDP-sugar pyrophosphorylase family protein